jgi:endonuclease YncB( thermonuclease family)
MLIVCAAGVAGALVQRAAPDEAAGFAEVIDGDSIRILGREIRLRGIDAPEYHQTCRNDRGEVPCGRDARAALAALTARGLTRCRLAGRDRYGRELGHCSAGRLDLNAAMVRNGHAVAYGGFEAEEAAARAARRGLWALRFERPADWRAQHQRERAS